MSSRTRKFNLEAENSLTKLQKYVSPHKAEKDITINLGERLKSERMNLSKIAYDLSQTFNFHESKKKIASVNLNLGSENNSRLTNIFQHDNRFSPSKKFQNYSLMNNYFKNNLEPDKISPGIIKNELEIEDYKAISKARRLQMKIEEYAIFLIFKSLIIIV